MACSLSLVIGADISEIQRVSTAIGETMRACSFSSDAILEMQLAVEEAVVNTVVHGYRGAPGEVTIAIRATQEAVEIRIEDRALPFDPLSIPEPDLGPDLDRRQIGGLGVYLIRRLADEVVYGYVDGKNVLTLVKRKTA